MPVEQMWPPRPRRLAIAVTAELVDQIVSGRLHAGEDLPTEPALCESFGVSRTVVREAVKALEAMRMVTVQQGQGTRVRPLSDWDLPDPTVLAAVVRHDDENAILEDLVDVRRALEAQMAGQAAARASAAERELITERLRGLETCIGDTARYLEADVAFHDAIMAAARNRLGRAIMHNLTEEAFRSVRYVGDPSPEDVRSTHEAHRALHDAVIGGDVERAERLMDAHIRESWLRRRPTRSTAAGSPAPDNRPHGTTG